LEIRHLKAQPHTWSAFCVFPELTEWITDALYLVRQTVIAQLWSVLGQPNQGRLENANGNPVDEVQQRLEGLRLENETLMAKKNSLEEGQRALTEQLARCRQQGLELQDANAQIQKLREQSSKYRSIITKSGNDNTELSDEKAQTILVELRDLIQRIVHRHYSAQGQMRVVKVNNRLAEDQLKFRDELNRLASESLQRFHMRAKIFDILDCDLLSIETFGAGEYEENLGRFEMAIAASSRPKGKLPERICVGHC
jgi:hypothetical protein